jgi:hypothetical protein
VKVTNDPLASLDVERIVTRGGAVNDVFPFATTEMKLGLASVDSGASVIVLVVVPVKDIAGLWAAGVVGGAGDEVWSVGLAGAAFVVDPLAPLDSTALLTWVLELGFTVPEDFTASEAGSEPDGGGGFGGGGLGGGDG